MQQNKKWTPASIFFFMILFLPLPLKAVTYSNIAITYSWIDAGSHTKIGPVTGGLYSPLYKFTNSGGCGTNPPNIDDTISDLIPLGFTFTYGDKSFTSVRIMSNGRLQFNNNTCGFGSPVTQLPYPNSSLDYSMRIYGNDLDPTLQSEVTGYSTACTSRTSCYVSYASLGTAPNRKFVITWSNVPEWTTLSSASGSYNMQVIVQENGEFIYQYGTDVPGPNAKFGQIGWQINSTDYAVSATGFPANNSAVQFFISGGVPTPGSFNAVGVGDNAVSGVIKTKISGQSFDLDVVALDNSGVSILTAFTRDVAVELVDASSGSCASYPTIGSTSTVSFTAADKGRKTVSLSESNAWSNVQARIKYPTFSPTVIACSSDHFAIRPAGFSTVAQDATWTTAGTTRTLNANTFTGTPTHKAGQPFTIAATALNAGNAVTTGYSGNPVASLTSCILPASGCNNGVFSAGTFSSYLGVLTSSTATYSEVGAITATLTDSTFASVDAADGSSAAERTITSPAFTIGRFVPDHFTVAANTPKFSPGCSSFTYQGQPFGFGTAPVLTITGKNNSGITTLNYTGTLWKLPADGSTITNQTWTAASGSVSPVGALPAPVVASSGAGAGTASFSVGNPASGGGLNFQRTTANAPFNASLTLSAAIADSDGITYSGNPYILSNIGFDDNNAGTLNDAQIRYGRINLTNAHGSELLDLSVPMQAEYYNGSSFIANSDDNCSVSAISITDSISTDSLLPADSCIWDDNSTSGGFKCATAAPAGTSYREASTLVSGNFNTHLKAPAKTGSLDIAASVASWLQFDWQGAGNINPSARATFGIYKGSDKHIYLREVY